jgi:hypothetical protein
VAVSRQQGVLREHQWGPGVASGKERAGGVHQGPRSTARRRERLRVATFNSGGGAPVVGGDEGGPVSQRRKGGVKRHLESE